MTVTPERTVANVGRKKNIFWSAFAIRLLVNFGVLMSWDGDARAVLDPAGALDGKATACRACRSGRLI